MPLGRPLRALTRRTKGKHTGKASDRNVGGSVRHSHRDLSAFLWSKGGMEAPRTVGVVLVDPTARVGQRSTCETLF